jgi:hypothetical protein
MAFELPRVAPQKMINVLCYTAAANQIATVRQTRSIVCGGSELNPTSMTLITLR